MHEVRSVVRALAVTLVLSECAGNAVSPMPEQDAAPCQSVESFCGSANYSARSSIQSFACECAEGYYFNATAQRCYNMGSCAIIPCKHAHCDDDDGRSAAKCVCEESAHVTSDCTPKEDFVEKCALGGGRLGVNDDDRDPFKCVCPPGTILDKEMCRSIACLFPNITCEEICADPKLREDSRCCQACNEPDGSTPNCEPGTIWSNESRTCKNVCSAGLAQLVCEHGCKAENEATSSYTCQCPNGEELSSDGFSCKKKEKCSDEEVKECSRNGRQCIIHDSKFQCSCKRTALDLEGKCSENCSKEKDRECDGPLSRCIIEGNAEKCVCPSPMLWNNTSKQCVPGQQFRYVVEFQLYNGTSENNNDALGLCNSPKLATDIWDAMKNLYGLDLIEAKVTECSNNVTVELTFLNDICVEKLRRIHLCEIRAGTRGCIFLPSLRILNGSVSGPVPVDLCAEYFQRIHDTSDGLYHCTKEGTRRYVLRCARGKVNKTISQGYLDLQICHDPQVIEKDGSELVVEIAVPVAIAVVVLVLIIVSCCWFRRRCCYSRLPREDPDKVVVTYAKTAKPEGETVHKERLRMTPRKSPSH